MDTQTKILSGFEELNLTDTTSSTISELNSEQEKKLDDIILLITKLSDITTEDYHKILVHVTKIPASYYVEIKDDVLKEVIVAIDRGVVKGPLALFRQEVIGESLDQIMDLHTALSAYI